MNSIYLDSAAQAHIQAYIEYKNIVGDTDNGKLLSEEEYAKRKRKALEDQKNRVYVTWLNENGLECRAVGPSSSCFCGHKFRDHDACNKQKKVSCKMSKCKCRLFEYIPIRGSQDLKCHCKHSYKLHDITTRKCSKMHPAKGLCSCSDFISSFGCSCGQPFSAHYTLFETRAEREKSGKRVDNLAMGTGMGCAALGGITSFSSLLDGVDRMSIQQNPPISDLQLQFMRPRTKMTEEEEMKLYARKYEKKPVYGKKTENEIHPKHNEIRVESKKVNMGSKLKLLKQKNRRVSLPKQEVVVEFERKNMEEPEQEHENPEMYEIEEQIRKIEEQLKVPSLSAAKRYALSKQLKMQKSKIIRYQRQRAAEKRRFEAGL